MEQRDYYILLYDFYGNLLNNKQQECFEAYYFDNLSLQEISENLGVSRNAIHKMLINVQNKLLFYEGELRLFDKNKKLELILSDVDKNLRDKIMNIFNQKE